MTETTPELREAGKRLSNAHTELRTELHKDLKNKFYTMVFKLSDGEHVGSLYKNIKEAKRYHNGPVGYLQIHQYLPLTLAEAIAVIRHARSIHKGGFKQPNILSRIATLKLHDL